MSKKTGNRLRGMGQARQRNEPRIENQSQGIGKLSQKENDEELKQDCKDNIAWDFQRSRLT